MSTEIPETDSPVILAQGDIYSNAYNFMSSIQAGVDPRTGLFGASIALPFGGANDLRGPLCSLQLVYSGLHAQDQGFGKGWELRSTYWDAATQHLQLSSGARYRGQIVGEAMHFPDAVLPQVKVTVHPRAMWLHHYDGSSELLVPLAGTSRWVLQSEANADGSTVQFHWEGMGGVARLMAIREEQGRELITFTYGVRPVVTSQPGTPAQAVMKFELINQELQQLLVDDLPGDGWLFRYVTVNGLRLLERCTQPTGSLEQVNYASSNGLLLPPGGPLERMPVAIRSVKSAGIGQPELFTLYDYGLYGTSNYFGWPAVRQWHNHEDNLYYLTGTSDFLYGSTERVLDANSREIRRVERTFNRFHLLTQETTRQGRALTQVTTRYHDDYSKPVAEQKPYFLFPHTVTTRKANLAENGDVLNELVTDEETLYDDLGNPTWHRDALGNVTSNVYYPVAGEGDACPPDPLGQVTRLKSETRTPPGTQGPVKRSVYRYRSMAVRAGTADFVQPTYLQRNAQDLLLVEASGEDEVLTELARTTQVFVDDPADPDHGRLASETLWRDGQPTVTAYTYSLTTARCARRLDQEALLTIATITGHDHTERTTQSAQALYTGQTVTEQDDNDVLVAYAYDTLQRRVLDVLAPDSEYEAQVEWAYTLLPGQSSRTRTGATGRQETLYLDNLGQQIRIEKQDDQGQPFTSWTGEYNLLGQLISETVYDPGNQDTAAQALTTAYTYDDWGNQSTVTAADGVITHMQIDPVALTARTWTSTPTGETGPCTVSTTTLDGRPLEEKLYTPAGALHRTLSWTYDGAGRCITEHDAMGEPTHQVWDALDRLVSTELPDGAQVRRTYAAVHQTLPATVTIQHPSLGSAEVLLGKREYDGLGRLVVQVVGRERTQWRYRGGALAPFAQVLADGTEVLTERIPELGDAVATRQAPGITIANTFHPVTGRLLDSHGQAGEVAFTWTPSGSLDRSEYRWHGDSPRSQSQRTTPGQQLTWTQDADGTQIHSSYDAWGRPASRTQGEVSTGFVYDGFSRVLEQHTERVGSDDAMTLTLTYDGLGQVVKREHQVKGANYRQVQLETLTWRADGKLTARALSRDGTAVRSEEYEYDTRGRLVLHSINGAELPQDSQGHGYREQRFFFDALDNILGVDTLLADGSRNHTTCEYDPLDPTQLVRLSHSHPAYPAPVALTYDLLGNLTHDERQQALHYDALGRLSSVTLAAANEHHWHYGPGGDIVSIRDASGQRWRYKLGGQLSCELGDGTHTRWARAGGVPVAESRLAGAIREVVLLGTDGQGSVTCEAGATLRTPAYGAYGHSPQVTGQARLGYTGALREPGVGWFLLGDYRVCNPALMRFHSRDSLSPFGAGGLNGYAYCGGDPINRSDPSGHAWWRWAALGVLLAASVVVTVASAGALSGVAVGVNVAFVSGVIGTAAAAANTVAVAAQIGFLATGNEKAAAVAGWVALGTGVASAAAGLGGTAAGAYGAYKAASEAGKRVGLSAFDYSVGAGLKVTSDFWKGVGKIQMAGGAPAGFSQAVSASTVATGDARTAQWVASLPSPVTPSQALAEYARTTVATGHNAMNTPGIQAIMPVEAAPRINVPITLNDGTSVMRPFYQNHPTSVHQLRQMISGTHPTLGIGDLAGTGIVPRHLFATTPQVRSFDDWQTLWSNSELISNAPDAPLHFASDLAWRNAAMTNSYSIWSAIYSDIRF